MELMIKNYSSFETGSKARAFLAQSPHHFIVAKKYPEPDLAPELRPRFLVLGPNRRAGYSHLPARSKAEDVRRFCEISAGFDPIREPDIHGLVRHFEAALSDKDRPEPMVGELLRHAADQFDAYGVSVLSYNQDRSALRFVANYTRDPVITSRLSQLEIPAGVGITNWVVEHRRPLCIEDVEKDRRYRAGVSRELKFSIRSLMAAPMYLGGEMLGVLQLVSDVPDRFSQSNLPLLEMVATMLAIFYERVRLDERRREMERAAGTAEVATSVLHNIGNILNSVAVSCSLMDQRLRKSKLTQLTRANHLLEKNLHRLAEFFTEDTKGTILPQFLLRVGEQLEREREIVLREIQKITEKSNLMRDIIETQQTISKVGSSDTQALMQVVDEAIGIQRDYLDRNQVQIEKHYRTGKPIRASKAKLIHILVNLIKNGVEAMRNILPEQRLLRLDLEENDEGKILLIVTDAGIGIEPKDLEKMFTHGFTTKEDGHGYGLHYCANAMEEMRGEIRVTSAGLGKGSSFTLVFPPIPKRV
ncbi:GAF domain-containing protein [Sulfidibacter corallicola]|uniref:histidine kinase n=1 Tax=Sulfidibacter corallicola TaxID=2818388 RepID=A0A8A4TTP9_SULCO|nr:ATP-binding protein [Sulfidibacter corallicola]QTD52412.1 GAF domain-containing protein [Sulfidibacter corallicola]